MRYRAMTQSPSPIVDEAADSRTTREKYEGERSTTWFVIFDALRDYRMSNMVFEGTDEPFCLVDLMSNIRHLYRYRRGGNGRAGR